MTALESINSTTFPIENYLKKLKSYKSNLKLFSKVNTRWFILDIGTRQFYYKLRQTSRNIKEKHDFTEILCVNSSPKVPYLCDWGFPFTVETSRRIYFLYAESDYIKGLWCTTLCLFIEPTISYSKLRTRTEPYKSSTRTSKGNLLSKVPVLHRKESTRTLSKVFPSNK